MTRHARSFDFSPSEPYSFIPVPVTTEDVYESTSNSSHGFLERNRGLFIIASSQFFFSLMELSVKILTALEDPVPMLEVIVARMAITFICCQVYMFASGIANPILGPKGIRKWLVVRGVVGFFGLFGLYYSLQYMSLSDATVLTFLSPTVTAALGFLFLQEPVSWKQGVAGLVSLSGVVLIARPTFLFGGSGHMDAGVGAGGPTVTPAQRMIAVCVALVGVLGAACVYTTIRFIGKRAHPMHMMSYFSLWCVLVSVIAMFSTGTRWVLPSQLTWLGMLVIVGFSGFCAQLLLTLGLQLETASRGSMALYTQIVFALAFERIVFGVSPSGLSVVGICVIMLSAIYVALNKPAMGPSGPPSAESTAMWELAPGADEGGRLLDKHPRVEDAV